MIFFHAAHSQLELVQELKEEGVLKSAAIEKALLKVDRKDFVGPQNQAFAYENTALPIPDGQTISQPYTVVFMLELLKVHPGQKILEIGAGSGWQSALLAEIVGSNGQVYAFELSGEVAEFGRRNLRFYPHPNLDFRVGNASHGYDEKKPYDRIISGAAFVEIPPELKEQLKIKGRLVAPTQQNEVRLLIRSQHGIYEESIYPGFVFVPIRNPQSS